MLRCAIFSQVMCEVITGGTDLNWIVFPIPYLYQSNYISTKIHITAPKRSNNAFHCYDKHTSDSLH